jgi:hypothetical protein
MSTLTFLATGVDAFDWAALLLLLVLELEPTWDIGAVTLTGEIVVLDLDAEEVVDVMSSLRCRKFSSSSSSPYMTIPTSIFKADILFCGQLTSGGGGDLLPRFLTLLAAESAVADAAVADTAVAEVAPRAAIFEALVGRPALPLVGCTTPFSAVVSVSAPSTTSIEWSADDDVLSTWSADDDVLSTTLSSTLSSSSPGVSKIRFI